MELYVSTTGLKAGLIDNEDGTQTLILTSGESILLEDTITHIIDCSKQDFVSTTRTTSFQSSTRAVYYTGFDNCLPGGQNRKYMLKGLEKYGIDPHMTYVGKYNDYYKSLPARDGYFIHPQNKKYKTEDPVHMGFIPASLTNIGFSIIESNEAFEVGATSIFYVDSDIRGIKWHKNVPCEPEDFIWYFQYIEE